MQKPILATLCLLAALPAQDAKKHNLRLNFKPGTVLHTVLEQDTNMDMSMGGRAMNMVMKMQMFTKYTVESLEEDVGTISTEFTRVKMNMDNPMLGEIAYDSADENSDPGMLGAVADLVGAKTKMKLTKGGKMLGVEVPDSVGAEIERVGIDLEQMFQQSVVVLPEKPVAIGDTWKTDIAMKLGQMGEMKIGVENKLVAVNGNNVTIEQKMDLDLDGIEMPGGMTMKITESKGTSTLDLNLGIFKAMNMTMVMKVGEEGDEMQMTMKMVQKMKEYTPKPAAKDKAAGGDQAGKDAAGKGK